MSAIFVIFILKTILPYKTADLESTNLNTHHSHIRLSAKMNFVIWWLPTWESIFSKQTNAVFIIFALTMTTGKSEKNIKMRQKVYSVGSTIVRK